jgi:hypothetical protein
MRQLSHRMAIIPSTQLVVRSYSAYTKETAATCPESHKRSWWIVHIQPTEIAARPQLLSSLQSARSRGNDKRDRGWALCKLSMNDPPTALVGFHTVSALVGFELNTHASSTF